MPFMRPWRLGAAALAAPLVAAPALAMPAAAAEEVGVYDTEQARFRLVEVVSGLEHPWGMAILPDGDWLVTERPGRLRVVENGERLVPEPVANTPEDVHARGQGGYLDVALDPDFASNRRIYLAYSASRDDGASTTRVIRARFADRALHDVRIIFEGEPWVRSSRHFGSRLVFDAEGRLYITMGERGLQEPAQDLGQHPGSVLRINPDGSVPEDNPFTGREDARPEIFTYGNRNPQGIARHPETGEIWEQEHGPQGGDEINILRAGTNYGWPVITHGIGYGGQPVGEGTHKEGMAQPLWYWDPSIAPSGLAFYTGDAFPEWQGDLFVGALAGQVFVRLEVEGEKVLREERMLEGEIGRIRDVVDGPDGHLYLLTDERDGGIYRIEPTG